MSEKLNALVDQLSQLTATEAADLAHKLEDTWGVSAMVGVAQAVAPAGGESAEAKTNFTVHLSGVADGKKIGVIKAVKNIVGLGLLEAKQFVEGLPKDVKTDVPKEEAEKIKKELEEAGGTVELK